MLSRDFDAAEINKKWVGGITYLWIAQGWMYLAVVLDVCSQAVVGQFGDGEIFRSFKVERYYREKSVCQFTYKSIVDEYILFYYHKRIHSAANDMAPVFFEHELKKVF